MCYRIGQGYDVHKLKSEGPLIIGGVHIKHTKGIVGHSDGDILVHSIIDALLGAFNLGDINSDGTLDVLDIVQILNIIVNSDSMPAFSLLDFNPNSEYNGQQIGPDFFNGQVSCYYFGKQG